MIAQVASKWLEMLLEIAPRAKKIAYLGQSSNQGVRELYQSLQETGRSRGAAIRLLEAGTPDEIARAFELMVREKFDGFVVSASVVLFPHRQQIVDLAARHRLPAVYPREEYVGAGGLLSYGRDIVAGYRRTADFVQRILQGAKPADLPVEQTAILRTVVNLATARELGIKIPQSILLRADRVIEWTAQGRNGEREGGTRETPTQELPDFCGTAARRAVRARAARGAPGADTSSTKDRKMHKRSIGARFETNCNAPLTVSRPSPPISSTGVDDWAVGVSEILHNNLWPAESAKQVHRVENYGECRIMFV